MNSRGGAVGTRGRGGGAGEAGEGWLRSSPLEGGGLDLRGEGVWRTWGRGVGRGMVGRGLRVGVGRVGRWR